MARKILNRGDEVLVPTTPTAWKTVSLKTSQIATAAVCRTETILASWSTACLRILSNSLTVLCLMMMRRPYDDGDDCRPVHPWQR